MKSITLIRGVAGSGKTTFAKEITSLEDERNYRIFSADDYFTVDGKYKYIPKEIGAAHKECRAHTQVAMMIGVNKIYVANTFTTEEEMNPYIELANKYGYKYFSIIVEKRHGNESIHNVPKDVITKMVDRLRNNIKLF